MRLNSLLKKLKVNKLFKITFFLKNAKKMHKSNAKKLKRVKIYFKKKS